MSSRAVWGMLLGEHLLPEQQAFSFTAPISFLVIYTHKTPHERQLCPPHVPAWDEARSDGVLGLQKEVLPITLPPLDYCATKPAPPITHGPPGG